jgi:hypothetical protein
MNPLMMQPTRPYIQLKRFSELNQVIIIMNRKFIIKLPAIEILCCPKYNKKDKRIKILLQKTEFSLDISERIYRNYDKRKLKK